MSDAALSPVLPWMRQKQESERAYEAFRAYRDQTPPRRIEDIPVGMLKSRYTWSKRHHWLDRAHAWDAYQHKQIDSELTEAVREMNDRHRAIARAMAAKVAQRLQRLNPDDLSPNAIALWVQTLVQIERLALGEATQRIDREGAEAQVTVNVDIDQREQTLDVGSIGEVLDRLARAGAIPSPNGHGSLGNGAHPAPHPLPPGRPDPGPDDVPADPPP